MGRPRIAAVLLGAFTFVACGTTGEGRPTALVLGLYADDAVRALGAVRVTAQIDGAPAADRTLVPSQAFPAEVLLVAPASNEAARVDVRVDAYTSGGFATTGEPPVLTRLASTFFVPKDKRLLRLRLDARCMLAPPGGVGGPVCPSSQTCIAGACADAFIPAFQLEPYAEDWATNEPDICKPAGAGAPEVFVGTGQTDYLPVTDGQVLQLEAGPQGGHHLWVAVRMRNLKQAGTITTLRAAQPGSSFTIPPTAFVFTYDRDEGGYCKLYGLRYQLDTGGVRVDQLLGKPLDLTVELRDRAGAVGSRTAHVQIHPEKRCPSGIPGCPQ